MKEGKKERRKEVKEVKEMFGFGFLLVGLSANLLEQLSTPFSLF